jgi:hypothetical protein
MTDSDILSRDIHALQELQRVAWSQLASPSLTIFDRREIRNRIRQSEAELKTYLKMKSERARFPVYTPQDFDRRRVTRPSFRLLAAD